MFKKNIRRQPKTRRIGQRDEDDSHDSMVQKKKHLLIPKSAFMRLVREISQDCGAWRWKVLALNNLQAACEQYLITMFEFTHSAAVHRKGVDAKITLRDLRFAKQHRVACY